MGQREDLRMSDDEVREFVAAQRKLQFASINKDGTPHIVPINYSFLGDDIAFWADPGSQMCANIRRDPRVTVLIEDGARMEEYRAVQIRGRAEIVDAQDQVQQVGDGFFRGFPAEMVPAEVKEATRRLGTERVAVVVHPDKVVSWDHRKKPGIQARD